MASYAGRPLYTALESGHMLRSPPCPPHVLRDGIHNTKKCFFVLYRWILTARWMAHVHPSPSASTYPELMLHTSQVCPVRAAMEANTARLEHNTTAFPTILLGRQANGNRASVRLSGAQRWHCASCHCCGSLFLIFPSAAERLANSFVALIKSERDRTRLLPGYEC